jgi:di/tricarboxylate transporter
MTHEQIAIFTILAVTVFMFLWGRWRHDMIAAGALLACVLSGLVPAAAAFSGFGHPAVITVACVLILSSGLQSTGAVDAMAQRILPSSAGLLPTIAALTGLGAVLSAFMNNIGALALLMPVAVQIAARRQIPAGRLLMPLAFGSILGGMTTMIGTPPNLIVSGFRAETGMGSFGMFHFTPVGAAVAVAGVLFITMIGWRLVPVRERSGVEGFETGAYLTEARVPEKAKAAGMTLYEIEEALDEADAQIVGLVRDEVRVPAPHPSRKIRAGDVLVIEAEPEALATALSTLGLKLEEDRSGREDKQEEAGKKADSKPEKKPEDRSARRAIRSEEISLAELTVLPDSILVGRSASDLRLRTRFGINLLAVSRQGRRSTSRLRKMSLRAGDVLLLQAAPEAVAEFAADAGCVPLAERPLRIPDRRKSIIAIAIMGAAVGVAAFGLVPAAIAFAAGVLAAMTTRVVTPRTVYSAVDWPIVVLLGTLIPVAGAMASTGAADLLARQLLTMIAGDSAVIALIVVLVVTMTLSDFMNNAATAAVMCPLAIGLSAQLSVSADPFLMAVAVGASCAFLTPIGHQNNTLILGPGGFRFGDYWRMGLPLEILVVVVSVPVLLAVWPL